MVNQVFDRVLRFFGTIATALTGLGAVCTAAGFLAERTRWSMLGFGAAPTDLNEYLFTGARFLAFLPGIALTSVLTAAAASVGTLLLALAAGVVFVVVRRRRARLRPLRPWLGRLRPWGLVALALAQFMGAMVLFRAGRLRNILFTDRAQFERAECGRASTTLEAEVLLGCETQLTAHMGRAFLIVLGSGAALWLLLPSSLRGRARVADDPLGPLVLDDAPAPLLPTALLGVNAALLAVLFILLPINYGVLFLRNEFPHVEVALTEPELRAEAWPTDGHFALLHRKDDEFYLYAPSARRVWMVPREQIRTLTYVGICGVFAPTEQCDLDHRPVEVGPRQTYQETP